MGSGGAFFVRDTRPVLLLLLLSGKVRVRAGGSWRTLGCRQYTVGPNSSYGARRNTHSEPLLTESGARSNHSTLFTLPGFSCFWLQVITVVPRPCCDWRLRGICTAHYQHRQETPQCYEQVEACALINHEDLECSRQSLGPHTLASIRLHIQTSPDKSWMSGQC